MGSERAAGAARALIEAGADSLVSWGVAGGLQQELTSGTLLLPKQIACVWQQETLCPDEQWRSRLLDRLQSRLDINTETMLSVSAPVASTGEKRRLSDNGYAAVDMESYAIAEVAADAGVPCVILRAVADPADRALPPLATQSVDHYARLRPGLFLQALPRSGPGDLSALLHMGRATRQAGRSLKTVVQITDTGLMAP